MNETTTVANVDVTSYTDCNLYNDLNGTMGNVFPPMTPNSNTFSDDILDKLLLRLKNDNDYSKDIQNVKVDNRYGKYIKD